ncbi:MULTISPECIES: hypothetical protein [Pseudomonas syringae group]|uniref:Uncharacterized protein n=2 Tax=Pseudomonas syringae group TaxID=136849 RepID=A0AAW4DS18_PSESX|nr:MULTISPECIES: hypothetical protein [Pseudomonas syringae group]AVI85618.1 hypothetical protein XJ28_18890 [Pseudomonas syringae pv. tomato]EEB61255.1 hypothetical protein PSPTOT1_3750 [Pseudomonas syringae pv. tomato T1]KGK96171.1 hypothetical protein NB04_06810 [Pseudomonas syringae pv. tomato]KUR47648.1 hypothetical protein PSTA9_01501 [Pseudomonas syringae pv. tomato]KUR48053.1 hypothetical protein PST407_02312 [Pseudomonas syringae pv. tomato]
MSNQFKPGDLALIVGAHTTPENIGKVCELVELLAPEQISTWRDPADGQRIQNGDVGSAWVVIGDGLTSWCGSSGWVMADPIHLLPLRRDFVPEQQKAKEAEPCA